MSTDRLIASHLRLAKDALDGAKLLLAGANRNAVYLAEQAVEQLVLALAQSEGVHYHRSEHHQLDAMIHRLPKDNGFRDTLGSLAWLEAYATTYRYPRTRGGISAPPSAAKLDETVAAIVVVLDQVAGHFQISLEVNDGVAGRIDPPR